MIDTWKVLALLAFSSVTTITAGAQDHVVQVIVVESEVEESDAEESDPAKNEVPLPALAGWDASLVYESDVGIWTVGTLGAFEDYGCPEVFGLDDKGRCTILASYSGKWTPHQTVHDVKWLGALAHVDLTPSVEGPEIYVGGQRGNLYQIVMYDDRTCDTRVIARFPGEEIHALVGGDLAPETEGAELLVFARSGRVWLGRSDDGEVRLHPFDDVGARIRQATLLPSPEPVRPRIAAACRCGELFLFQVGRDGLERAVIASEPMGLGRLAVAPESTPRHTILYVTRDDGVILRFEENRATEAWDREIVYAGPQGPRGLVAGRFSSNTSAETIATFGYSGKVQLLSRVKGGPWSAETIFEDRDKGHWLEAAELDGRNATDELLASGYGGRVVLLSRPPAYGLPDVPVDPDLDPEPAKTNGDVAAR